AFAQRYDAVKDDENLRDLMTLALYAAETREAADVAWARREGMSKRAQCLALLSHARYTDKLESAELEDLGRIAGGGSPLDATMQIEAAWLYARRSGKAEQAITL